MVRNYNNFNSTLYQIMSLMRGWYLLLRVLMDISLRSSFRFYPVQRYTIYSIILVRVNIHTYVKYNEPDAASIKSILMFTLLRVSNISILTS